jgi:hypothetical protein
MQRYIKFLFRKIFRPLFRLKFVILSVMKNASILLAALFVAFTPCAAQGPQSLKFGAAEHDFGEIREEAGPVSHSFTFENAASHPVAIDRVSASCGCTTPEYPRAPVAMGGKAHIEVTFDPWGQLPGDFSKTILVTSDGGRSRTTLTIKGRIIPRRLSVEEEFPHDMGGGLRLSENMAAFRTVPQGAAAAMTTRYVNASDKTLTLALSNDEPSGLLEVHAPETIGPGDKGTITLTYDLTAKAHYGPAHDVLRPVVDGVPSAKTLYAAMTGVDDFSGVSDMTAPRFFLDASFHDFGQVRRRTVPYVLRMTASNEGAEPLHIRSVAPARGVQTTLRDGMSIAPGEQLPFEVMFYSSKYSAGEVTESIRIVVNDPLRPTREIRIKAIIK